MYLLHWHVERGNLGNQQQQYSYRYIIYCSGNNNTHTGILSIVQVTTIFIQVYCLLFQQQQYSYRYIIYCSGNNNIHTGILSIVPAATILIQVYYLLFFHLPLSSLLLNFSIFFKIFIPALVDIFLSPLCILLMEILHSLYLPSYSFTFA